MKDRSFFIFTVYNYYNIAVICSLMVIKKDNIERKVTKKYSKMYKKFTNFVHFIKINHYFDTFGT